MARYLFNRVARSTLDPMAPFVAKAFQTIGRAYARNTASVSIPRGTEIWSSKMMEDAMSVLHA